MEMTPGQIMEAEISATLLDENEDSNPEVQPQGPASGSLRLLPDDTLGSEVTLPDNLFTPESPSSNTVLLKPPVITEETEVDTDDVNEDLDEASSTDSLVKPSRKRPVSGSGNDESNNLKRARVQVNNPPIVAERMRTRTRNLSNHLKNKSGIHGIKTTESSRASSISKKS